MIQGEQLVDGEVRSPEPVTPDIGSPAGSPTPQPLSPLPHMGVEGIGGQVVELATPLMLREGDLDVNHDEDVSLQFRTMNNILGPTSL
jgi:hypothetical protein